MPLDLQWLTGKVRKRRKKLLRFTRVSSCFPCRREKGETNQPTHHPSETMKSNQSTAEAIQRKINRLEWRAYAISPLTPDLWEIQQELFAKIDKLREELDALEEGSKVH